MKREIRNILSGVVASALATGLWGCAAENPFDYEEGTGTVRLHTVVNNITTRADGDTESSTKKLEDNCVVYISRANGNSNDGLIKKWVGLDNVDSSLTLATGNYVAEAWSGDSVTASFDAMFFRGTKPFTVTKGATSNVVIDCKIQNVVVSVNTSSIDPNALNDDYKITISNSRGELAFDKNNAGSSRGYFMMPNGDDTLEYEITATAKDGSEVNKSGIIKQGVERAHHYILNFKFGEDEGYDDGKGAVFFEITIADEDLNIEQSVQIPTPPTVSGIDFDIEKQLNFSSDDAIPEDGIMLKVCAFGDGIDEITISSASAAEMGLPTQPTNVYKSDDYIKTQLTNAGLTWTSPEYKQSTDVSTAYLYFSKALLRKLTAKETEHVITIGAKDTKGYTSETRLRIARSEEAVIIEDPVMADAIDTDSNPMAITGTTASITITLAEEYDGTPGVEYCKDGEEEWKFAAATGVPAKAAGKSSRKAAATKKYTVTLTDLEPGLKYKYRAACGDFHGTDVMYLTTETPFTLPNASFEEWSTYSASTLLGTKSVTLPGNTGDKSSSFWGSGNEGAATANMTLTDKSTDMLHSGTYSVKLASNSALGVIAAGNLFIGEYVKTDGTNGVLSLGRTYNGTHPKKVRVYANYRPATGVTVKSSNSDYLPEKFDEGNDHGQIYIALTTEAVEIRTNPDNRKLFDPNDECVVAYGEVTWTENFGPDGALEMLEIPFEYNARANSKKPTHIIIVCSASKYGDYFSGAKGSTMYLDDFELVY